MSSSLTTGIVTYCVLAILTFSIGFVPLGILRDFDVTHPDVNTELSTPYLFNISIHFWRKCCLIKLFYINFHLPYRFYYFSHIPLIINYKTRILNPFCCLLLPTLICVNRSFTALKISRDSLAGKCQKIVFYGSLEKS